MPLSKKKILLVDDEKDIIEFLEYNLTKEGYDVITANDGKEALTKLELKPDLIILDVMMPKMDGFQVCTEIRNMGDYKNTPIIFLTAKSNETDEIHGLNLGAVDYIKKPVSPKKLLARVKANFRKSEEDSEEAGGKTNIQVGPLLIDREKYIVTLNGSTIVLPRKEFQVLYFLASRPGIVFDRDKILCEVWGNDIYVVDRTVDVHVRKIREKLGDHAGLIETIKGVGYRFKNFE